MRLKLPQIPTALAADNPALTAFHRDTRAAFEVLLKHPQIDAHSLGAHAVSTTALRIPHKLGRSPSGWIVTRINADARIWESQSPDGTAIYLVASAPATVSLLVW